MKPNRRPFTGALLFAVGVVGLLAMANAPGAAPAAGHEARPLLGPNGPSDAQFTTSGGTVTLHIAVVAGDWLALYDAAYSGGGSPTVPTDGVNTWVQMTSGSSFINWNFYNTTATTTTTLAIVTHPGYSHDFAVAWDLKGVTGLDHFSAWGGVAASSYVATTTVANPNDVLLLGEDGSGGTCGSAPMFASPSVAVNSTYDGSNVNVAIGYRTTGVSAPTGYVNLSYGGTCNAEGVIVSLTAHPAPAPPQAPSAFAAGTPTTTTIPTTWVAPPGTVLNYTAYRGTTCAAIVGFNVTGPSNAYTFTGLSPSTPFCLALSAWNATGQGVKAWTNATTATPAPVTAPVVLLAVGLRNTTAITVSWVEGVSPPSNYTAYIGASCWTLVGVNVGPPVSPANHTFKGLTHATAYCIAVSEWSGAYESAFVFVNASTRAPSPAPPPGGGGGSAPTLCGSAACFEGVPVLWWELCAAAVVLILVAVSVEAYRRM